MMLRVNHRPNVAVAVAVLVALAGSVAGCSDEPRCLLPELECGGRCLDVGSDPANCGGCGFACSAGETCCAGGCTDVSTSAAHCGACDQPCFANGVCTAGACSCPESLPDTCGPVCLDLQTGSHGYCGTCGLSCQGSYVAGLDAPCVSGACVCAGTPEAKDCGANPRCVNTLVDEHNCGGCGDTCKWGAVCTGGVCGCTSTALPDECPTRCVDHAIDPENCGTCGAACTGSTPTCSSGKCCPTGRVNCSGTCVDPQTDAASCGTCGHACTDGRSCVGGTCACAGVAPVACGTSCCAGTACCAGGTACQTPHSNGIGGTFYDCVTAYALPSSTTPDAALAAANSWHSGQTYEGLCGGNCLARQTTASCGVWCYGLSPFAGHVTSDATLNCDGLCLEFQSTTPTWP